MNATGWAARFLRSFQDDPLTFAAIVAAMIALATTPIAFAVLGRIDWFKARRGRVLQKPEFSSIVAAMILVMGIPAIFLALAVKSRHFDKDRYEFDPNKTWSVLEQGRGYNSVKEADAAVKVEMERLAMERKNLVNTVKKLDEAMLTLRAAAVTSPAVAQAIPNVLERLAKVRQSVGVDGPQQLMDFTAPPVEIAALAPAASSGIVVMAPTPAPVAAPVGAGLTKPQRDAEIAAVPAPQKPLASFLPLVDIPTGWTVGKSGEKYVETFNADNLFEKIDGRAESFVDFKVKGMAYTYYHPVGDDTNEIQVYIFELGDTLKALGKYGTEKPDQFKAIEVGAEGYTTAGSTLFYSGAYYTQIVSTKDDAKFAGFALEIAKRIAVAQKPGAAAPATVEAPSEGETPAKPAAPAAAVAGGASTPESLFALLPKAKGRANQSYVPADVFGYAFLTDVFLAEYTEGNTSWKGFLRPYESVDEAKAAFEKYLTSVKQDGAEIKEEKTEGADRMVVVSNIGLIDAFFLKGNCLGGAAGATEAKPAVEFARGFAKALPEKVPMIGGGK